MARNPRLEKVEVMCEAGCGCPAVGAYPVHQDNPASTGAEVASNHSKWSWATLCAEDGGKVCQGNPGRMPAVRYFAPRR